ncbi:MAG: 3-deoxy-D-manno-octulosonate 8-phosphate phosphatase [Campylobacter sp.]|nr:3-deoxy-D-manno-octulosonate 8-phosphate phosphatase [Campylobacter sp.]
MIDIIFFDIDGCMSDGGIYYSNTGIELKKFDVKDGFGISNWNKLGKISAIITGRESPIILKRAEELGIKHIRQGVKDKFTAACEILDIENLTFDVAAAIGDDYNDIKLLNAVSLSFKPKDAMSAVKADITLSRNGGNSAIREMIEYIIQKDGLSEIWFNKWL